MNNSLHEQYVDVLFGTRHHLAHVTVFNKLVLQELILDNATENTVFYCWYKRKRIKYFVVECDESETIVAVSLSCAV